jgi:hypothetical protein
MPGNPSTADKESVPNLDTKTNVPINNWPIFSRSRSSPNNRCLGDVLPVAEGGAGPGLGWLPEGTMVEEETSEGDRAEEIPADKAQQARLGDMHGLRVIHNGNDMPGHIRGRQA